MKKILTQCGHLRDDAFLVILNEQPITILIMGAISNNELKFSQG